jgi:hypothetical protein
MLSTILLVLVGLLIGWNTTQPAVVANLVVKAKGLLGKK